MLFEVFFKRAGVSRKWRPALKSAHRELQRSLREYDKKVDKALADPRLSRASKRFLSDLWYGHARDSSLSLGNRAVREAASAAAVIVLARLARKEKAARKGRLRLRMLTTTGACAENKLLDWATISQNHPVD